MPLEERNFLIGSNREEKMENSEGSEKSGGEEITPRFRELSLEEKKGELQAYTRGVCVKNAVVGRIERGKKSPPTRFYQHHIKDKLR